MAARHSQCLRVDNTFGPHAADCRGGFDFTLLFEESILSLLPLCLLLIAVPPRILYLLKRQRKVVASSQLWFKLCTLAAFAATQLALLVLWAQPSTIKTRTTIATYVISLLGSLVFCALSYVEHMHSVQPSAIFNAYLIVSLLSDIARTRTLWLRQQELNGEVIAEVFTTATVLKFFMVIFEALEKRQILRSAFASYPPEATSGLFNRSFFWWLNSMFRNGFSNLLTIDDLFTLDKHLATECIFPRISNSWAKVTKRTPNSLFFTAFKTLKWAIMAPLFPRACLTALTYTQPFLVTLAINLSVEPVDTESTNRGYGLIGAYVFVYVGIAICMGQYQHLTYRSITMVRGGLIAMLYRKATDLSMKDIDPAASMTLMSADIERIVQGWQSMHEIWANSAEVAIAIYLLKRQIGVACVIPVGVSIFSMIGSIFAMNFIMSRQALWLEAIEKRISATTAMVGAMKGIKMTGLKQTLFDNLHTLRRDELEISKKFRRLLIWNMGFAYVTQVFAPILTFMVFALLARNDPDHAILDTSRVFTSLALFALLAEPLSSLIMALVTFTASVGCFTRIQEFLVREARVETRQLPSEIWLDQKLVSSQSSSLDGKSNFSSQVTKLGPESDISLKHPGESPGKSAILIQDGSFGWDPEKESLLKNITIDIPRHKFTMLVGPVGCGKSTLLKAILGEVPSMGGTVQLSSTKIAFCDQTAWHMNDTIQQSIIGVSDFDEKWYNTVLQACALDQDLQQLTNKDETIVGSKGIALSGGQSQRIALARAIYAQKEIVILDDALSGLDASTEHHVFHSLLGREGLFRRLNSTVLIASSAAKRVAYADHVISLDPNGTISEQGTFEKLEITSGYVSSFNLPKADWEFVDETSTATTYTYVVPDPNQIQDNLEAQANRSTGDMTIYLYYIQAIGWWPTSVFFILMSAFIFGISFPQVWLKWWAAANEDDPNGRLGYWLSIYAALGIGSLACLVGSCWQMIITMVPKSGESFHYTLLKTVLDAPLSFFSKTDSGTIINRFSQDLQLIDMELPIAALNTFATFVLCIAQMILIGVASTWAAISFPILIGILYLVQKYYLRTSRQLRFMDLEAKAPLYSQFAEILSGLATVRAFGWQKPLEKKNRLLLDRSQRPFYLLFAAQRWLTLLLDLIVAAIAVLLAVLVVKLRGTLSAGFVGIALLNVVLFSQSIKLFITFWTMLETHIGAIARIKIFEEDSEPEEAPGAGRMPPPSWPTKGAIDFVNVSASYKPNEPVLRDVTLSIKPGEKIGVCGRTGSGKSSFVLTLFRMIQLDSGSITIDGIDTSTLFMQEIRSRVVGVSQDAFLIKGSVRLNADPLGVQSDEGILAALKSVHLEKVTEENGGLDADMDELHLSHGQKQLFCLARAMLRPSTILVLDEATSNVDGKTDKLMQRLIREKFSSHTIIAVAHKLDTILDFDKVAMLEAGKLIEFDDPYALLNTDSAFARLYNSAVADLQNEQLAFKDDATSTPSSTSAAVSRAGSQRVVATGTGTAASVKASTSVESVV